MDYREYPPPPDLESRIRCAWTLTASSGPPEPSPVLPDGHPELVLNFSAAMRHHPIDYPSETQPRVILAGVITRPFHLSATGEVELLGIRFQPAGAAPLAPGEMFDLVDRWAEPVGAGDLAAMIDDLRTVEMAERVARVWEPLRARLDATGTPANRAVELAANRILASDADLRIDDLAAEVGLGSRQLARRFRREVGVGPKLLSRIARFQRALRHLSDPDPLPASRAAVAAGYVDQAHMISDVSDFSGLSPGRLFRAAQPLADLFTEAELTGRE